MAFLTSMSSFTCSCWSLSSPNASMIKPEAHHNKRLWTCPWSARSARGPPTLDDGQQDDNDEEEESDVEQDAVELVGVSGRVLQLISNPASSSDAHVHVEHIALPRKEQHFTQTCSRLHISVSWNCLY